MQREMIRFPLLTYREWDIDCTLTSCFPHGTAPDMYSSIHMEPARSLEVHHLSCSRPLIMALK